MLQGVSVNGDKGVQSHGPARQGLNSPVDRVKLPGAVFFCHCPLTEADGLRRLVAVLAGAPFLLGGVGVDGRHGETVEAAADISFLVDHGHHVLAAGGDDNDPVVPDAQHGLFIADVGPAFFPPARGLFQGQLVQVRIPGIAFGVAAVALGDPGRMAGLACHAFMAGIETGFIPGKVERPGFVVHLADQDKLAVLFPQVGDLFVAAGHARTGRMTHFTAYLQGLLVMGIAVAVTHDLVPGMAVDADHPLGVMDILGNFQVKAVAGQPFGGLLPLFIGGAVPFGLKDTGIGYADPAAPVVAPDTVILGNFFDYERVRLFLFLPVFFVVKILILFIKISDGHRLFAFSQDKVTGRTAAPFFIEKLRGVRQVVLLFPEVTGGTELPEIVQGI